MSEYLKDKWLRGMLIAPLGILIAGCTSTIPHASVRERVAQISVGSISRVELLQRKQTIALLESGKDDSDILELLQALKEATRDARIGKGGGRPDTIRITTKGGGREIVIVTDFERLEPLLGMRAQRAISRIRESRKAK